MIAPNAPPGANRGPAQDGAGYGYGGVGDYALSHGNTPEVLRVAHQLRDGRYDRAVTDVTDTREVFDLIVVGGGFVARTNWRFLYQLGVTGCRWFEGFGFSCNIRQPMIDGDYRPPLHPEQPIVMTFYVPLYFPGHPIQEQGTLARAERLGTSYQDHERRIREQMVRLLGGAGLDPRTDIAGIALNRWGHALMNPPPGFYFGREGSPAPPAVIRPPRGRIAFAHSELRGNQGWTGAAAEGRRAVEQLMELA
jgi:spermidine dehydrogenase